MTTDVRDRDRDRDLRALYARLDDLAHRAERGECALTAFLTPREGLCARRYLAARWRAGTVVAVGGYPAAERVRMCLLPDYIEGLIPPEALEADPVAALRAAGCDACAETVDLAAVPLCVDGSGFRTLTHRDYLGAILGLGLDRDAIGDVQVVDEHTAYLVCKGEIVDFLLAEIRKIGADTVKVRRLRDGEVVTDTRRFTPVNDTVASGRLDCVVAAIAHLSRDKAQTAVRTGLVEMNYETAEDCDTEVQPPCVLSVRGVGKFIIRGFDGETRKGRLRLKADQYT